jgi:predicted RNA-binding protein with PUA-like domain
MNHWLFKTEPETFSWTDFLRLGSTGWDGVRNAQARNLLRDTVQVNDLVFFYHSGKEAAIVGLATVSQAGHPDPTQFDPASEAYDERATPEKPIWYQVKLTPLHACAAPLSLARLRLEPRLEGLMLIRKGMMLSVQPVSGEHAEIIRELGDF